MIHIDHIDAATLRVIASNQRRNAAACSTADADRRIAARLIGGAEKCEARAKELDGGTVGASGLLRIPRSISDITDLRCRYATLAEAGGEGALEAVGVTAALDWLFGNDDTHPLATSTGA